MKHRSVWKGAWSLALRTLRRRKIRAVAMAATLAVGVLAITLTVATGEGARRGVEKSFRSMLGAFDVLIVQPGGPAMRGMARPGNTVATLTPDDVQAVGGSVANIRASSMAQTSFGAPVEANGINGTTTLFGVTPSWFVIRGDSIVAGAAFTAEDNARMARVAVVGSDVPKTYFNNGRAVGQSIRVNNTEFQIVGVLAANGAGPGGISLDNLVYIPIETSRRRVFNRDNLDLATFKLDRSSDWATPLNATKALLRERHGIRPPALDDFQATSPEAIIARYSKVDSNLRRGLFWVGFLALAIGGVIIANVMFSAATAQRREIGTRRALGATRQDILAQFWSEALTIAGLAVIMGVMIGVIVTRGGAMMMMPALAISWPITLLAVALAFGVGAVAGYFPARRACSESPTSALRSGA